jgi:hypothetical protein
VSDEIDSDEAFLLREFFCEMIIVAFHDATEKTKYKSEYKQREVDQAKDSALKWFAGDKKSPFPFEETCHAVGIEPQPIIDIINNEERLSKVDMRAVRDDPQPE